MSSCLLKSQYNMYMLFDLFFHFVCVIAVFKTAFCLFCLPSMCLILKCFFFFLVIGYYCSMPLRSYDLCTRGVGLILFLFSVFFPSLTIAVKPFPVVA